MNLEDPNRWYLLAQQLKAVMPECLVIAGMCAVLLATLMRRDRVKLPLLLAMISLASAFVMALGMLASPQTVQGAIFSGMAVIDPFSQFFKVLILLVAMVVVCLWLLFSQTRTPEQDVPDYLCLLLGATLGMMMMTSASNLLMIFLALESASLPSYVLAGFRKRSRMGSEGSLKYVIFGSAASAVTLYGMSLIYGVTGHLQLSHIAAVMSEQGVSPLLAVGLLSLMAGIGFKLASIPMHFWTPDVFQGAPIEVATLLAIASKGAAVCLLVRILQSFSAASTGEHSYDLAIMCSLGLLGSATATWGNLVALRQTNIRRLLAYSSIAHAGYLMMASSVILMVAADDQAKLRTLSGDILFYLLVYVFMNLGAFTVAGLIAMHERTNDIRQYAGLIRRNPLLAVLMVVFMLSLFGMPGLGGFMGKIFIASQMFAAGPLGYVLIAILLFNTLLSFAYYLRPGYYMIVTSPAGGEASQARWSAGAPATVILLLCAIVLVWTGLLPGSIQRMTHDLGRIDPVLASTPEQPASSQGQWRVINPDNSHE